MDTMSATITLNPANATALALMASMLTDVDVIRVYETAEGEGLIADAAAVEMDRRNIDY